MDLMSIRRKLLRVAQRNCPKCLLVSDEREVFDESCDLRSTNLITK